MIYTLAKQYQLYILFAIWFVSGLTLGIVSGVIILPSLLILLLKNKNWWAILGLIMLMIFSDSRNLDLSFAQQLKGFYFLIFSLFFFFKNNPFKNNPIVGYFIPFFIILMICIVWSDIPVTAIQKSISYILLFLVIPTVIIVDYKNRGLEVFKELTLFVLIILLLSLIIAILLPGIGKLEMMRWNGFLGNPNGLGIFVVLTYLYFEVSKYLFPSIYSKSLKIFFYIAFVALLYGSGSRGAMLAIAGFWFAKVMMNLSVFLGIIGIIFFLIFMNDIFEFLLNFLISMGYGDDLRLDDVEKGSGRLVAWQFAWNEIQANTFLLGKGIDHEVYFMQKNYEILSMMGHEGNLHNSYLSFWMNTGLAGLIAFFMPFIVLFTRAHKRNYLALPTMFAIMISINFESWMSASLNPFTILFVIILTLFVCDIFYKKKENVNEADSEITVEL